MDEPQQAEWIDDSNYFHPAKRKKGVKLGIATNLCSTEGSDHFCSLPNEIMAEIFAHVSDPTTSSICASVCKRWLFLQSHMHIHEDKNCPHCSKKYNRRPWLDAKLVKVRFSKRGGLKRDDERKHNKDLHRHLSGKTATDIRLAAIAVGTRAKGGLDSLTILGSTSITNMGIKGIGLSSGALRILSLQHCLNVGNDGLKSIAFGCRLLEKLDLRWCPKIGDRGLLAISRCCLHLEHLILHSCNKIRDDSMDAIATSCNKISILALRNCKLIGKRGVISFITKCKAIKSITLDSLKLEDECLEFLSQYPKELAALRLRKLHGITEKGFISLGESKSLVSLKTLIIEDCKGLANHFLSIPGGILETLCTLYLYDCQNLTWHALDASTQVHTSLEHLRLNNCTGISFDGIKSVLQSDKLRTLQIKKCIGLEDEKFLYSKEECGKHLLLKSLSILDCDGIVNRYVQFMVSICPSVEYLDLTGTVGLTDDVLLACCTVHDNWQLKELKLARCCKLTDNAFSEFIRKCGKNLNLLDLYGCLNLGDDSMLVIGNICSSLQWLDISRCNVTDDGVVTMLRKIGPSLRSLSLTYCGQITDKCLSAVRECLSLTMLNIENCVNMSPLAVNELKMHLGSCHIKTSSWSTGI